MIHSNNFMQLMNTSTFSTISSGIIQSPKYIKNGDFVNETHFVLSTANGYILLLENDRFIVWKQVHNIFNYNTLKVACISNLIYFMTEFSNNIVIGAVNLTGDLMFIK